MPSWPEVSNAPTAIRMPRKKKIVAKSTFGSRREIRNFCDSCICSLLYIKSVYSHKMTNPARTPRKGGKSVTIWKTGTKANDKTPITKMIRRERAGISGMYSSGWSSSLITRERSDPAYPITAMPCNP